MTSFEAVQVLSARARSFARFAWFGGAAAILVTFFGVLGAQVLIMGRPTKGMVVITTWATVGAAALILTLVKFGVKQALRLRRPVWIEDLARQEGLDAKKLAESFTLDSW